MNTNTFILPGNPKLQYLAHETEIDLAIRRVLDGGYYILGEECRHFEREFAQYIGVEYGIGVGSGTEALHLALAVCGVGAGDEVITVSQTAVATIAAIEMLQAIPVFVDIDPDTYTLEPTKVEGSISKRTKAILPVHLYGHPADMPAINDIARKYELYVVEDCAQSHGASINDRKMGAWGDISAFSFYPTKNLGAIGDGGMVVTNNKALAERASLLRQYGWKERFVSSIPGWNTRLDEIQAAILRCKLPYLEHDNTRRRQIAATYTDAFKSSPFVLPTARIHFTHCYHQYVIRHPKRDELREYLHNRAIATAIHYPRPVHLQPAYRSRLPTRDRLTETEKVTREILSLPIYPELRDEELERIIEAVLEWTGR